MTSILRLGSKDRSSFLFRRQSPHNGLDGTDGALAHRLPDISYLDTTSLTNLFDHFVSSDHLDALPRNRADYTTTQAPTVPTPFEVSVSNVSSDSTTTLRNTIGDQYGGDVARHDSTTSSCYSQASQRESEYSPFVTRHSSRSSYTPEPLPPPSMNHSLRANPATGKGRTPRPVSTSITESHLNPSNSKYWKTSSSILVVSLPPDLDKPLPPGPADRQRASSSVPDLLRRHTTAELPSSDIPHSRIPAQRSPEPSETVAITRCASESGAISEMPPWSAIANPEPRSEKGAPRKHQRNRSFSETAVQPRNDVSRRHTADFSNPVSSMALSSSQMKLRNLAYKPITAATAERVIYRIMCNLHSVEDLRSTAMISKGFLRTFQRNESKVVSHLMFKTSRPAWELRRSLLALKGSNDFALKDYRRDCNTLSALKTFIAAHCSRHCKQNTLLGLLGQDDKHKAEVDNALWRIWTFCTLFGNSVGQSRPSRAEIDWLNGNKAPNNKQLGAGFAVGNGKGLTTNELEAINEMWQSLQILLSGFHGREQEAKQAGVFDNWHLRETTSETQHLAEWISYLLALGPQIVLSLSTSSFEHAKMLGLTKWPIPPAGQSRSGFLTTTLTQVYQERVLEEAALRAAQFAIPRMPGHRPTRSLDEQELASITQKRRAAELTKGLRINTSSPKRRPVSTIALFDPQLEIRPDCDPANTLPSRTSHLFPASPTADPTVFYTLGMTSTASTKLGATLFPMDYASPAPRVPFRAPEQSAASDPAVVDPVDKAMAVLVREFGFGESRARKALAMCDTGSGIDLRKAIELLSIDAKNSREEFKSPVELPTPSILSSPGRLAKPHKAVCDGHCSRNPTITHSRKQSTGTVTETSVSPISATDEAEWHDTMSPLVKRPLSTLRSKATLTRGPSKSLKAWKVLAMDNLPKRKNSVLGIDEYQAKVERRKSMRAANGGQTPRVKDGLSKSLLGLGLGIGSSAAAKSAEDQLERARQQERRKRETTSTNSMPRYA